MDILLLLHQAQRHERRSGPAAGDLDQPRKAQNLGPSPETISLTNFKKGFYCHDVLLLYK